MKLKLLKEGGGRTDTYILIVIKALSKKKEKKGSYKSYTVTQQFGTSVHTIRLTY